MQRDNRQTNGPGDRPSSESRHPLSRVPAICYGELSVSFSRYLETKKTRQRKMISVLSQDANWNAGSSTRLFLVCPKREIWLLNFEERPWTAINTNILSISYTHNYLSRWNYSQDKKEQNETEKIMQRCKNNGYKPTAVGCSSVPHTALFSRNIG